MPFAVAASFAAALLIHLVVLPPGYLAAALYIVPVVLVASRWGWRATAAAVVAGAAAVSWHAIAGGVPLVLWAAGVLALALVGYLAVLLSRERSGAER